MTLCSLLGSYITVFFASRVLNLTTGDFSLKAEQQTHEKHPAQEVLVPGEAFRST